MRRSTVVAALFVVLLAACSDDDEGQQVTAAGSASTTTSEETTTTTTTTEAPTTTTTAAPASTTTAAPPAPAPTTTTTTFPANAARVTLVNDYPKAVTLVLNGVTHSLAAGQRTGPIAVIPAENGNDTVTLTVRDDPSCGVGDADDKFDAGRAYTFRVFTGEGAGCGEKGSPVITFSVTPA